MPLKISTKLFAAIHAGNLIKDTKLEGGDVSESFDFLINYFESNKEYLAQMNELTLMAKSVKEMNEKLKAILLYGLMSRGADDETKSAIIELRRNNEPFDNLAGSVIEEINKLEPGKRVVIPGGWVSVGGNPGHAMLYAVELKLDGTYEFKIFNTGAGTEKNHASGQVTGAEIFEVGNHAFTIEGLKLSDLNSQTFKTAMSFALQQQVRPNWEHKEPKPTQIYDEFKIALVTANPHAKIKQTNYTDLHKLQKAGNCYYYVMKPLLREMFPSNYDEIQLDIKLQSILEFYETNKSNLADNLETYHLLKFAVQKLANATNKRWQADAEKPSISKKKAQEILKECQRIEHDLTQIHQTRLNGEPFKMDLKSYSAPDNTKLLKDVQKSTRYEPFDRYNIPFKVEKRACPTIHTIEAKTSDELISRLRETVASCTKVHTLPKTYLDILTVQLREYIYALPAAMSPFGESYEKSIYAQLSVEQKDEFLDLMNKLFNSFHYFAAKNDDLYVDEKLLPAAKLLSIMDMQSREKIAREKGLRCKQPIVDAQLIRLPIKYVNKFYSINEHETYLHCNLYFQTALGLADRPVVVRLMTDPQNPESKQLAPNLESMVDKDKSLLTNLADTSELQSQLSAYMQIQEERKSKDENFHPYSEKDYKNILLLIGAIKDQKSIYPAYIENLRSANLRLGLFFPTNMMAPFNPQDTYQDNLKLTLYKDSENKGTPLEYHYQISDNYPREYRVRPEITLWGDKEVFKKKMINRQLCEFEPNRDWRDPHPDDVDFEDLFQRWDKLQQEAAVVTTKADPSKLKRKLEVMACQDSRMLRLSEVVHLYENEYKDPWEWVQAANKRSFLEFLLFSPESTLLHDAIATPLVVIHIAEYIKKWIETQLSNIDPELLQSNDHLKETSLRSIRHSLTMFYNLREFMDLIEKKYPEIKAPKLDAKEIAMRVAPLGDIRDLLLQQSYKQALSLESIIEFMTFYFDLMQQGNSDNTSSKYAQKAATKSFAQMFMAIESFLQENPKSVLAIAKILMPDLDMQKDVKIEAKFPYYQLSLDGKTICDLNILTAECLTEKGYVVTPPRDLSNNDNWKVDLNTYGSKNLLPDATMRGTFKDGIFHLENHPLLGEIIIVVTTSCDLTKPGFVKDDWREYEFRQSNFFRCHLFKKIDGKWHRYLDGGTESLYDKKRSYAINNSSTIWVECDPKTGVTSNGSLYLFDKNVTTQLEKRGANHTDSAEKGSVIDVNDPQLKQILSPLSNNLSATLKIGIDVIDQISLNLKDKNNNEVVLTAQQNGRLNFQNYPGYYLAQMVTQTNLQGLRNTDFVLIQNDKGEQKALLCPRIFNKQGHVYADTLSVDELKYKVVDIPIQNHTLKPTSVEQKCLLIYFFMMRREYKLATKLVGELLNNPDISAEQARELREYYSSKGITNDKSPDQLALSLLLSRLQNGNVNLFSPIVATSDLSEIFQYKKYLENLLSQVKLLFARVNNLSAEVNELWRVHGRECLHWLLKEINLYKDFYAGLPPIKKDISQAFTADCTKLELYTQLNTHTLILTNFEQHVAPTTLFEISGKIFNAKQIYGSDGEARFLENAELPAQETNFDKFPIFKSNRDVDVKEMEKYFQSMTRLVVAHRQNPLFIQSFYLWLDQNKQYIQNAQELFIVLFDILNGRNEAYSGSRTFYEYLNDHFVKYPLTQNRDIVFDNKAAEPISYDRSRKPLLSAKASSMPISDKELHEHKTSIHANQHHTKINALQSLFEITEKPALKVQPPFSDDEIAQQESPIVKNSMTQFNQRYLQEAAKTKSNEHISKDNLQKLITDLQKQSDDARVVMTSLSDEILKLINTPPDDEAQQLQLDLEIQAGKRKPLSLENAMDLFLANNPKLFEKNTYLNADQQDLLMNKMMDYLIHYTQVQQAERSLSKAKSIDNQFDTASAQMMSELYHSLQKRMYHLDYHALSSRAKITLEAKSNILLRAKQAAKIDAMCDKDPNTSQYPSLIVQMLMGDGKTKVVSATIARVKADGTSVPVIVVPNAIYELNKNDLLAQSSDVFGQRASTFTFNRTIISANEYSLLTLNQLFPQDPASKNADLSERIRQYKVERVQAITKKFDEMLSSCGYFVLTPDTLHSIDLAHVDALRAGDEALETALYELKNRFKSQSDLIIDEVDTVLHVRKETHYTLDKPETLREDEGQLILIIYNDFYSLPNDPQRLNVLLEKIIHYESLGLKAQEKQIFVQAIKDLWADVEKPTPLIFLEEIRQTDPDRARLISLAKEQLSSLMPLVMSKKLMVDFGPSKATQRTYAIPYANNNNPNEVTDFANIYEILNYTIRMFYEGKIDNNLMKQFLYTHKELMRDEAEFFDAERVTTKVYQDFKKIFGLSLILIDPEDPKALEELTNSLKEKFPRMADFLTMMVLPTIKSYPYKISHFGTNLVDMFRSAQGLTGTPWNINTFNPKFKADLDVGAEERVAIALIEKQNNSKVVCLDNIKPDKIIEQLEQDQSLASDLANLNALIDVGALFAGQDNQQVAQGFLTALTQFQQKFAHIKGVLFFDLATKSLKIMGPNGSSVKLNGSDYQYVLDAGFKPEDLFTYYDQSNTTGTDVRQQPNAIAYMTVDKETLARDTFQGAFRMRKLLEEQHVKIAIPLNVYQHYQQVSKQPELRTKDIVKVNVLNEGHLLGEDVIRGMTQNINNVFRQSCEILLKQVANSKERIQLYTALSNWYESKEQTDAYDLYGKVQNLGDPKVIFAAFITARLEAFKTDLQKDQVISRFSQSALDDLLQQVSKHTNTILQTLIKGNLLPNKSPDFVAATTTGLVEVESQLESTQQQTKEKQTEKESQTENQVQTETQVTAKSGFTVIPRQEFFQDSDIYQDDLLKEVEAVTLNSHIAHTLGDKFANLYDANIFVSAKLTKTVKELPEVLLTPLEKIPLHLFVIQDPNQKPKILLLDESQSRDLQNRMIAQKGKDQEQRIILHYSMNGEMIHFGNNAASKQAFIHPDPKLNYLLVQCQHFVGDIHSASQKAFRNEFKKLLLEEPINIQRNEFFEKRLQSDPKNLKLYHNIKKVVMNEAAQPLLKENKLGFFAHKTQQPMQDTHENTPQLGPNQ